MFQVGPIFARSACTSVKAKPVSDPLPESCILAAGGWNCIRPVDGADMLDESQQNKLKANINQLWLERTATSEIITAGTELVRNMRGEVAETGPAFSSSERERLPARPTKAACRSSPH